SSYTYAHARDYLIRPFIALDDNHNLAQLDPLHPRLDKGDSDFDLRHRIVFSGTWDLSFARNTSGIGKRALDGSTVAPIISIRTGFPFTLFDCTEAFTTCPRAFQTTTHQRNGSAVPDPSGAANL